MSAHILVGIDGSASALAALDWATRDAAMRGVPLLLVHILAAPVVAPFPEAPMPVGYAEWQEAQGRQCIRDALERVGSAGSVPVSGETVGGSTVPALVELSRQAAMIVVGRRGHGRLRRSLLGSVSSALVRHAHCPVAVVHDDEEGAPTPGTGDPVVVGIDGSPVSERATALAFEEASFRGVELVAVYAWHDTSVFEFPGIDLAALQTDGELMLAERLAGFQERYPDVAVRRVVACDRPSDQLVEQSRSAQLLVVGSHGRGGFAGMLLGSVSAAVVQAARTPVIDAR